MLEGRADALLQINPSPERLALFDFSDPLLLSEFMIFTAADRLGVAGLRDLRGLRVGVERKGLPIQLLQAYPDTTATPVPDLAAGLRAAGDGRGGRGDRGPLGGYLRARCATGSAACEWSPAPSRSESAIAVRKGDTNMLADINAALAALRRDGEYDAILDRWRPKEVVFRTARATTVAGRVTAGISAMLLAAPVSVVLLVREVRRRRRVETAVRESESRYRTLVGVLPAAVYSCDVEGRITFFNELAAELWGRRTQLGDSDQRFCGAFRVGYPMASRCRTSRRRWPAPSARIPVSAARR